MEDKRLTVAPKALVADDEPDLTTTCVRLLRHLGQICLAAQTGERYTVEGELLEVIVQRKGATRSFGPGARDVPEPYRAVGQPVIIGGSMETAQRSSLEH